MEFRIFGSLGVVRDGSETRVSTGKTRLLLAVLLCHPNEPVPRERLIDALWGDDPPKSAVDNLRVYVSQLRKLLDDGTRVVREPRGYALTVKPGELDADRFEELVTAARACDDPARAGTLLRQALALAQEPPFADVDHLGPIATTARRLEEQRAAAAEAAVEADLALGRNAEAIAELYSLIDTYPLREGLRRNLMLALYRSGRQAEALAAYREAREALVEELGIEPGPALRDLETRILNADPTLNAQPPHPLTAPTLAPTSVDTPPTALGTPPTALGTPPTALGTPPTALGTPSTALGTPPTAAGTPPTSSGTTWGSWLWAAIPLLSCGYGTPWAFVYAAVRRRSLTLALSALIYVALCGIFLVVPLSDEDGLNKLDIIPILALITLWLGGTCHAVLVRDHVFTQAPSADLPRWKKALHGTGLALFALVAVAGYIWLEPPT